MDAAMAEPSSIVRDPVADFLTLHIEDRYSETSEVSVVHKIMIDIDLDGQPEILVGHSKMWTGDNNGVYFAIYKCKALNEYERLTQPNQDVRLMLGDGEAKFVFVGQVDELNTTGLLIFNPPHRDAALSAQKIESRQFLSISKGILTILDLPGLDLTDPTEKVLFDKYSEQAGKQGGFSCELLASDKLKELGYALPDWTKLPSTKGLSTGGDNLELNLLKTNAAQLPTVKESTLKSDKADVGQTANKSPILWIWIAGFLTLVLAILGAMKRRSSHN